MPDTPSRLWFMGKSRKNEGISSCSALTCCQLVDEVQLIRCDDNLLARIGVERDSGVEGSGAIVLASCDGEERRQEEQGSIGSEHHHAARAGCPAGRSHHTRANERVMTLGRATCRRLEISALSRSGFMRREETLISGDRFSCGPCATMRGQEQVQGRSYPETALHGGYAEVDQPPDKHSHVPEGPLSSISAYVIKLKDLCI